jgi:hypothetical protein
MWILTITDDTYNYKLSPTTTYVAYRKLKITRKQEQIRNWFKQNLPTRQILRLLKAEDKSLYLIAKDINNACVRINTEFLASRIPIQALLIELLTDGEWLFRYVLVIITIEINAITIEINAITIEINAISIEINAIANTDLDTS